MQISEKREKANEREEGEKNWVSPIWIFLVVKRDHFIESAAFLSCTFFFSSSHFYQSNWFWPFWVNGIFIRFIVSRIHYALKLYHLFTAAKFLRSLGKWSFFFFNCCAHVILASDQTHTCDGDICSPKDEEKKRKEIQRSPLGFFFVCVTHLDEKP